MENNDAIRDAIPYLPIIAGFYFVPRLSSFESYLLPLLLFMLDFAAGFGLI